MDRMNALYEKIDTALRDDASGMAVFDILPAWAAEFEAEHDRTPGTSGGAILLDHYMHETSPDDFDEEVSDGLGSGMARLGRCVYRWDDAGFYQAHVYATLAKAQEEFTGCAPAYDTGEEG